MEGHSCISSRRTPMFRRGRCRVSKADSSRRRLVSNNLPPFYMFTSYLAIGLGCLVIPGCEGSKPERVAPPTKASEGVSAEELGVAPVIPSAPSSADPTEDRATSAATTPPAPTAIPETARPKSLEDQALSLLNAWRKAQRLGRLQQFSEFYASDFTGVALSREPNRRYEAARAQEHPPERRVQNRATWLLEHKRTFASFFFLATDKVQFTEQDGRAVLEFEEQREANGFPERERKRLVLERRGNELKIVSEEVLSLLEATRRGFPSLRDFAFVTGPRKAPILLVERKANLDLASGPLEYVADGLAVRPSRPPSEAAWALEEPHTFRLFDHAGKAVCTATATRFVIVADVVAPLLWDAWSGKSGPPATPPQERAVEIWKMTEGERRQLGLELRVKAGDNCEGSSWGRSAAAPPAVVLHRTDLEARDAGDLVKALKRSEAFRYGEREFQKNHDGAWMEPVSVRVFRDADGSERFVSFDLLSPRDQCGSAWFLLAKWGDGYEVIAHDAEPQGQTGFPRAEDPLSIDTVLDVDGDGLFELIAGLRLMFCSEGQCGTGLIMHPNYHDRPDCPIE